jgi:hypothetical protein
MFVFILILTAFYFMLTVIWETTGPNKYVKVFYVFMMLYGATLISGVEGVTAADFELSHLVTRTTASIFLIVSALQTLWLGWYWSKRNWLNLAIKYILFAMGFVSVFYAAEAIGFITVQ